MKIFGIPLPAHNYKEVFKKMTELRTPQQVFTPNPEILLHAKKDHEFANILKTADILTIDGIGIYVGAQIMTSKWGPIGNTLLLPWYISRLFFDRNRLKHRYGDRICGSDLTQDLVLYAQENHIEITIVDRYNPTDSAKVAAQKEFPKKLASLFPKLVFHYFIYNPAEKSEIIERIAASNSRILFSTLGMKQQEVSVQEIMKTAKNITLGLGVGSSFDYFTGFQKRAPKWMRNVGIEWLYRLYSGPRKWNRLKRLWRAIVVFPLTVIWDKKNYSA